MASTTTPTSTGITLPSFKNTLGALFIGSNFATALYGVTCVQTFLYLTSRRSQFDTWAMTGFVLVLFVRSALDISQQCVYSAGLYKFLITDFANPLALNAVGPNSGLKLIAMDEGLTGSSFSAWCYFSHPTVLLFSPMGNQSNHVINLIIITTVNTNLITTLLSLVQLITFLVFPTAQYYAGITLVLPKSYMNCFLAMLNYRDYLQKKLDDNITTNLVTLESTNARLGSSHSTSNTMSFRDGIHVHIETKSSNAMAV
ncbi:hypothetical protein BT96DRAFT_1019310 [Gymnopus androsaceus JB14]|uniref:DUF6534 domain-containing protein n=1 Tax=Gymnopus androsaceus JB14 TaxID=1447944 RepID=A0A6A4HQW9_9AGAR|nr:hypothetical protein BT96DRAFT_1019310 [Gymnopus androsaceus JB14]